jgi:hypothetical protein
MRREVPKKKVRQQVALPPYLVQFLTEVHQLILAGDKSATTSSDDLIQADRAYGGLVNDGGFDYQFVYFPDKRGVRNKWEFTLSSSAIKEIADGKRTALTLWACPAPDCGCKFTGPEETCFHCDYEEAD